MQPICIRRRRCQTPFDSKRSEQRTCAGSGDLERDARGPAPTLLNALASVVLVVFGPSEYVVAAAVPDCPLCCACAARANDSRRGGCLVKTTSLQLRPRAPPRGFPAWPRRGSREAYTIPSGSCPNLLPPARKRRSIIRNLGGCPTAPWGRRPRSGLISRLTSSPRRRPVVRDPVSGAPAARVRVWRLALRRRGPRPMWAARARVPPRCAPARPELGLDLLGARELAAGEMHAAEFRGEQGNLARDNRPADRPVRLARGEHEQRQPGRARERLGRHRRVGGQLGGAGELPGGACQRTWLVAFKRDRPRARTPAPSRAACAIAAGSVPAARSC